MIEGLMYGNADRHLHFVTDKYFSAENSSIVVERSPVPYIHYTAIDSGTKDTVITTLMIL